MKHAALTTILNDIVVILDVVPYIYVISARTNIDEIPEIQFGYKQ